MNKAKAIHQFWSSFNWTAIDEQSAYDEAMDLPDKYIAYELQTANLGDSVALTASLWHRSTSWEEITEKADEIAESIGYGGKVIPITGGYLWIKLGQPFAQRMSDENKADFRRIYLTIMVDFLSAT